MAVQELQGRLEPARWRAVVVYAIAMALLEAAVVTYLRTLLGSLDPYRAGAVLPQPWLGKVELAREAATLTMLGAVAWLAGDARRTRFAYFLLAFGVWDLFYYVFLVPMTGWPRSLFDWDVLFLIPLPWWGPVIAPASIAALMVVGGTVLTQCARGGRRPWPARWAWTTAAVGAALALYAFMSDALRAPAWSAQALGRLRPAAFDWPLFLAALALMCVPLGDALHQLRGR